MPETTQRRPVVAFISLTLDGVMQAPGRADEDPRDGFARGGWATPYAEAGIGRAAAESMAGTDALLFGRRTYEDFHAFWPGRTGNPFTEVLNNTTKYVASRTLTAPLPWKNSTLLGGDAADAVATLTATPGKGIVVLGSGELLRSLMKRDLVDRFILLVHPLVLSAGRRLFADDGPPFPLRLESSHATGSGVVIAAYARADRARGRAGDV
jgi:dihydrofolate reductase